MRLRDLTSLVIVAVLAGPLSSGADSKESIKQLLADGKAVQAEAAARSSLAELDQQNPAGTLETAAFLDLLASSLDAQAAGVVRVREAAGRAIAIKARLLCKAGDRAGARALLERAIHNYEHALGSSSAKLVEPLLSLGQMAADAGALRRSEALYQRALEIQRQTYSSDHRRTGMALDHLAALRGLQKNYAEEAALEEDAIRAFTKAVGEQSPYVSQPLARMAVALGHLDRPEEAARAARESAEIRRAQPDAARIAGAAGPPLRRRGQSRTRRTPRPDSPVSHRCACRVGRIDSQPRARS